MISVEELLADPPKLHLRSSRSGAGDGPGLTNQWKLSDEELLFISRHVAKSSRTLETGAGCSTILFAMLGSRHTCIVPDQPLVDRILAFCNEKQIPTANLSFIVGISERVLPQLKDQDFDLVLVDGRHGFPQLFLDWYYAAELLKVGGYVVIDDLHIWVCDCPKKKTGSSFTNRSAAASFKNSETLPTTRNGLSNASSRNVAVSTRCRPKGVT
jgi:Methyltransferase domain